MENYTLYLNYFNKDSQLLIEQLNAIRKQTHKPAKIIACFLGIKDQGLFTTYLNFVNQYKLRNWHYVLSNYNIEKIGRYELAQSAPTDYVIMLDDDYIPAKDFAKTMVSIAHENNAIVHQYGWQLLKNDKGNYEDGNGIFWHPKLIMENKQIKSILEKNNKNTVEVDYLKGGMTFHKKHLINLFKNPILTDKTGEDILLCLTSKQEGIKILVYSPYLNNASPTDTLEHKDKEKTSKPNVNQIKKVKTVRNLLIQKYKQ